MRALRGATTVEVDDAQQITERVSALLEAMLERNEIDEADLISILFTATSDIHSIFPAAVARKIGLTDVPLMCARELDIDGSVPLCIRVMAHFETDRDRSEVHHVYLEGATQLRNDLPG